MHDSFQLHRIVYIIILYKTSLLMHQRLCIINNTFVYLIQERILSSCLCDVC